METRNKKRKCEEHDLRQLSEKAPNPLIAKLYDLIEKIHEEDYLGIVDTFISDKIQKAMDATLISAIDSCEEALEDKKQMAGNFLHNLAMEKPGIDDLMKVINAS